MPNLNDDAAPDRPGSANNTALLVQDAADRIEAMLSSTQVCDPVSVSTALCSEPVRAELQAVLAQLGPDRLLPVLHRLATGRSWNPREVFDALFTAEPSGAGQVLRGTLQALQRQAVLARIFHPDRVQALRSACRPPVQEHA